MNEAQSSNEDALWAALRECPARLDPGLSEAEIHSIEEHFEFRFAPDHRLMLSLALPLEDRRHWPDWRNGTDADLRDRLAWPVEGLLFDVEHDNLWHPNWGPRPNQVNEVLAVAGDAMRSVPPLVPIYGHRYLPSVPSEAGNPVLSCYQADIIYYGTDLLDWFKREFRPSFARKHPISGPIKSLPFWTWFLEPDD